VILFDLDGTLLPMDQEAFTKRYFQLLAAKLAPRGYDPKKLIDGIWAGTAAMVKNDGSCTNEEAFWNRFAAIFGEHAREDEPVFDAFYHNEFSGVKDACGFNEKAAETVHRLHQKGYRIALATNPLFPAVATGNRIRWAGLKPEDFELYTTYENSRFCKPNPKYYQAIADQLGVKAEECLMIGNDVTEDMIAETLGMKVFLLTDCLINKENRDISRYPHGSFEQLMEYIDSIGE
jgi:HAD superfamily hydrolase (TIGR01549 family)